MKTTLYTNDIERYLQCSIIIDFDNASVAQLADKLYSGSSSETEFIRKTFEYVRDRISHSADIGADEVTCTASQVLAAGHGICFAKSHLLAAILRCKGVPAGFCYQKLVLDDDAEIPELIYHGLNGVYLKEYHKWIRLDARGNKEGVNAQFSIDTEQLAFPIRREKGEEDDFTIYPEPDKEIVRILASSDSRAQLWTKLPMQLEYNKAIRTSIDDTRKSFEESFAKGDFYNRQTQDSEHLQTILRFINVKEEMRILDLGTGSGYLAFPIAREYPDCTVVGLDIVSEALAANRERAAADGISNLKFVSYGGIDFPFEDEAFDLVVTRYALHHFPDIDRSIGEVSRVLKKSGRLFISDPRPNACDTERFVDDYMRLKKDGHIKFYTKNEWINICGKNGLELADSFDSSIRFPKKKDTAAGYEQVLAKHSKAIIESYDLTQTDTELYLTEQVNNMMFIKI
jgi:ubiquinone/menaquinone biosynthesis C-methylase UbiE